MTHGVLLLDGGMGQELIRRSPSPAHHHWSLQVMLEQPELVAEVTGFLRSGCRRRLPEYLRDYAHPAGTGHGLAAHRQLVK